MSNTRTFYVRRPVQNLAKTATMDTSYPEAVKRYKDRVKMELKRDIAMLFMTALEGVTEDAQKNIALGGITITERTCEPPWLIELRADAVVYELAEIMVYVEGNEIATSEDELMNVLESTGTWFNTTSEIIVTKKRLSKYDKLGESEPSWEDLFYKEREQ